MLEIHFFKSAALITINKLENNTVVTYLVTLCKRKMVLLLSIVTSRLILTRRSYLSCLVSSSFWKTWDRNKSLNTGVLINHQPRGGKVCSETAEDAVTSEGSYDGWWQVGTCTMLLRWISVSLWTSFTWGKTENKKNKNLTLQFELHTVVNAFGCCHSMKTDDVKLKGRCSNLASVCFIV